VDKACDPAHAARRGPPPRHQSADRRPGRRYQAFADLDRGLLACRCLIDATS